MRTIKRVYRFIVSFMETFFSMLRILHFRAMYPSIELGFDCFISSGVVLVSCDGAQLQIRKTHIAKGAYIKVEKGGSLKITDCYVGAYSMIVAHDSIEIKPHCSIGEMVVIRDQNHVYGGNTLLRDSGFETAPIIINENVWLGTKATILQGVVLGENVVVGAHSLVNESFPENSVIVGSPARPMSK
ncbi:MAG: acyltransferase [Cytophagales bacterium]|nr:acyltransferase [Cytophagales bacterium]